MFKAIQCSVQGRGHERSGTPCQDKTFVLQQNGVWVAALADGAGSASLSHLGAECVTEVACHAFAENFDKFFGEQDADVVRKELAQLLISALQLVAEKQACCLKDLASTLLVAAVKDNNFLLLHIGDGVIGYLKHDELKVASHPMNGEFANVTYFVTSSEAASRMKLIKGSMDTIRGFVLMSDGTENSLYDKRKKKLAVVVAHLINSCLDVSTEEMTISLEESFRTIVRLNTMDDCSMVLLVDDKNGFPGFRKLSGHEKSRYLGFRSRRNTRTYEKILEGCIYPSTACDISRKVRLKLKYARKRLATLCRLGYLVCRGNLYQTNVLM